MGGEGRVEREGGVRVGEGKRKGGGFKEDGGGWEGVWRGREGGRVWERDLGALDNNH